MTTIKRQVVSLWHSMRWTGYGLLFTVVLLCAIALPGLAHAPQQRSISASGAIETAQPPDLLEQGRLEYEAGQFETALKTWGKAEAEYTRQGDRIGVIRSRLNQAQALKALGNYRNALEILKELDQTIPATPPSVEKAQSLRSLGDAYQNAYQSEEELKTAEKKLQDSLAMAQTLQATPEIKAARFSLGIAARTKISRVPPQALAIASEENLGKKLEFAVELEQTVRSGLDAFAAAKESPPNITTAQATLNQIGLLVSALPRFNRLLMASFLNLRSEFQESFPTFFLQTVLSDRSLAQPSTTEEPPTAPRILNLQRLTQQTRALTEDLVDLLEQVRPQLEALPPSRAATYARINLAQSLTHVQQVATSANDVDRQLNAIAQAILQTHLPPSPPPPLSRPLPPSSLFLSKQTDSGLRNAVRSSFSDATALLKHAIADAQQLGNKRSEAYAYSVLADLYGTWAESTQPGQTAIDWRQAESLSKRGMILAQDSNAPDIAYRLQRQYARALAKQGQIPQAQSACKVGIATLQSLRSDLVAANQDVQFTFQESVEPFYRECVGVLLPAVKEDVNQPDVQEHLEQARQLIESLQLAELDNFFREACIEGQKVVLDKLVDQNASKTAVIYPILLSNHQLRVIVKVPTEKNLRYRVYDVPEAVDLDAKLATLGSQIANPNTLTQALDLSQQVYTWLIAPFDAEFQQKGVDTLMIVPDKAFRNVPMAALYNKKDNNYLIDKYAIAVNPGLQLLTSKSTQLEHFNALVAGLSDVDAKYQLGSLPGVTDEISSIQKIGIVTHPPLQNTSFTSTSLAKEINAAPFNIVHLATHGVFSSRKEETFILMADGKITVEQFSDILRSRGRTKEGAIDLLVLSACQTAKGDNRAALGLAGIAIRSGARSTLASLWSVNDESTAQFIDKFYQSLVKEKMTKAKAVRTAQLYLKQQYKTNPDRWAPYVLVGNWL
jgi:CHAT domain-containing protein